MNLKQHIADGPYTVQDYVGDKKDIINREGEVIATIEGAEFDIVEIFGFPARVLEVLRGNIAKFREDMARAAELNLSAEDQDTFLVGGEQAIEHEIQTGISCGFTREDITQ